MRQHEGLHGKMSSENLQNKYQRKDQMDHFDKRPK